MGARRAAIGSVGLLAVWRAVVQFLGGWAPAVAGAIVALVALTLVLTAPLPGGPRARAETVISHLTITRPTGEEHRDDRYDLRCYDRRQWRRLLDRSRLKHLAGCDASGEPFKRGLPNYQIEVLGLR